ncbi:MAG TPA: metallophosphoesterase [Chloroflexota bacterium]|nr:metallophosphoesterase [Chloroflexota bacterium]
MRIALIGDTHGYLPALEAAVAACRALAPDLIVHCGDFLSTPFTPDPPEETIALLKAEGISAIVGNGEAYLRDWGTPRYGADLVQRRARADSPDYFLPYVPAGQAQLRADDLAWLRALPDELVLDGARPGDVYVCHGMPGNPFSGIWPSHLTSTFDRHITVEIRDAALSRRGPAEADLILHGHAHSPFVQPTELPNGRTALAVRGTGIRVDDSLQKWWVGYVVLTHRGTSHSLGFAEWDILLGAVPWTPRDPSWTWEQPPRR